jgi:nucleotide-binding universal stress UspA family protein
MFKRVLHPTDFSKVAFQAFDQAVALASRFGAELHVVHVIDVDAYDRDRIEDGYELLDKAQRAIRAELEPQVDELVASAAAELPKVEVVFRRGSSAAEKILEEIDERGADLVVMGTHGRSRFRELFLGSVAEKVVRYAPCPVMVLGRKPEQASEFSRILVPVDFSQTSEVAAGMAVRLARKTSAEVCFVHVLDDVEPPPYFTVDDARGGSSALERRAGRALDAFVAELDVDGLETRTELLEGRPSKRIASFAKGEGFDLILFGSSGLHGIDRRLLGSTTIRVLHDSLVPVLVVHYRDDRVRRR